jgi:hypothetical protein
MALYYTVRSLLNGRTHQTLIRTLLWRELRQILVTENLRDLSKSYPYAALARTTFSVLNCINYNTTSGLLGNLWLNWRSLPRQQRPPQSTCTSSYDGGGNTTAVSRRQANKLGKTLLVRMSVCCNNVPPLLMGMTPRWQSCIWVRTKYTSRQCRY